MPTTSEIFTNRADYMTPPSAQAGWDDDPSVNTGAGVGLLSPFGPVMAGGEANLPDEVTRTVESPKDLFRLDETDLDDISWFATPMDNAFWLGSSYEGFSSTFGMPPVSNGGSSRTLGTPAAMPQVTSASSGCSGQVHGPILQLQNHQPPKPLDLEVYDREVVNVFLNIFYDHVPASFPVFRSYQIAKAMYNDARRTILGTTSSLFRDAGTLANLDDALIDIKTLLLLEIYGLCSGDRRSYELTEAHHLDLQLQAHSARIGAPEEEVNLLESLYALDLYRVVIVQRPPMNQSYRTDNWNSSIKSSEMAGFLDLADALSTPGAAIENPIMRKHHFGALASLSAFVWPALRTRSELGHPENPLWNVDFAVACCDKWLRGQGSNNGSSSLVMYHTTSLMLHVDILLLQRFATRHSDIESQGQDLSGPFKALRTWAHSEAHQAALWHARSIFHYIETIYDRTLHRNSQALPVDSSTARIVGIEGSSVSRRLTIAEAPHVPYATYFATIVLCTSAALMQGPDPEFTAYLTKGKHFLSQSRLCIAKLLSRVLDGARWPSAFTEARSETAMQS
ncbi:uncharacterized protein N7498_000314 [Penicillium cinerascens]|uniref:Transcription factor domain-containing protein n=1 Tax=Penicillium cinerascens TaxID=70096 RepID=A0A9W9NE62_9EURO|nr:uncharacterized protein N7498_000314 [Penicillium cinerascens]KAJ5218215.1 hypothetical protein N7498_000314 [Penicillium cinerascens]